jgi:hypothetical protein
MGEILATLQSFLAASHRLDETNFLLEVTRNKVLYKFVWIAALLGCGVHQFSFELRRKVDFHCFVSFPENTLPRHSRIMRVEKIWQ